MDRKVGLYLILSSTQSCVHLHLCTHLTPKVPRAPVGLMSCIVKWANTGARFSRTIICQNDIFVAGGKLQFLLYRISEVRWSCSLKKSHLWLLSQIVVLMQSTWSSTLGIDIMPLTYSAGLLLFFPYISQWKKKHLGILFIFLCSLKHT